MSMRRTIIVLSATAVIFAVLEYVLFYLYDRTKETAGDVYTPMDIYRQAIQGKPAAGTSPSGRADK